MYSTLLAHKKLHIRNFAAESFTFLMRKVSLIFICLLLINPQEYDEQKLISFIPWLLRTNALYTRRHAHTHTHTQKPLNIKFISP